MTQPASSYVVCCLYVHVSWKPEYSIMLCRYQLVSSVRSVSIVVLVVSMLANEISFLFCGGHTGTGRSPTSEAQPSIPIFAQNTFLHLWECQKIICTLPNLFS
eukprot:TRINITY_DN2137_c0_g2_i2.p1 TRINITY_DN2137_c0_g2~~TRINITY_DN2137_c0_g2_i2.p1  ORF type:complete len:103 (+),score=5.56 TRINITY_DN2137_c0_g2_i2:196-504(+)